VVTCPRPDPRKGREKMRERKGPERKVVKMIGRTGRGRRKE